MRYDQKGDLDWWRVARDMLTQEKPNFVVMMLGVSDRQGIRERDLAKDAEKKKGKEADKPASEQGAQNKDNKDQIDDQEPSSIAADRVAAGKKDERHR